MGWENRSIMPWLGKALFLGGAVGIAVISIAVRQDKPPTTLELVKDYANWTKANVVPIRLSTSLDMLCRGISNDERKGYQKTAIHFDRYMTVYVNPTGEKAMQKGGVFPVGSIIVKEKRDSKTGPVVLSTVMIKREKGYNPACGDWQFAALNSDATKTDGDGKLDSCMKCHKDQSKKDFVYRTYVGAREFGSSSGYDPGKGLFGGG